MIAQEKSGNYDVLVVGGGIVGLGFTSALAKKCPSLNIAIVDPQEKVGSFEGDDFDPRVVALSHASRALLADAGAWGDIEAQRACPYFDMHVWDGEGTGSIHFDCGEVHTENLGHIVENSVALKALRRSLVGLNNVTAVYGDSICDLLNLGGSGETGLSSPRWQASLRGGAKLEASVLVAADGADSPIREKLNISVSEKTYGHTAIVATVRCEKPHQFTAWQRFSQDGPLAFLPLQLAAHPTYQDEFHCSIVWSVVSSRAEELLALDDKNFCTALSREFEFTLGEIEQCSQRHSFPLRARHAQRYISAGAALIGDSAHTIHPLAGQGVNLGLADAQCLLNEIARAFAKGIPLHDQSLFRRFERQRRLPNTVTLYAMQGFKSLFERDELALRFLRNEGLRLCSRLPWLKTQFIKSALS